MEIEKMSTEKTTQKRRIAASIDGTPVNLHDIERDESVDINIRAIASLLRSHIGQHDIEDLAEKPESPKQL